jgi:chemotaxis protein MotB
MKTRELGQLVNEKSDLLDNLKSKNTEVKTLSKIGEENSLVIFELKRDVEKLNKRLSELSRLLIDAEEEDKLNKVRIKNLGQKLNQALAGKVAELRKYQSVFFKKIQEAIGQRDDIIISGDRFIFPSEVFFESGSDIIQLEGIKKLAEIANSLIEISDKIPKKIDWILRVDGHTDKIPIRNERFDSNWHLSSSRAINIVKFFISKGIEPHRLVAAGFGENYPIESGESEESFKKNRRIEIKLTTR